MECRKLAAAATSQEGDPAGIERTDSGYLNISEWVDFASKPQRPTPPSTDQGSSHPQTPSDRRGFPSRPHQNTTEPEETQLPHPYPDHSVTTMQSPYGGVGAYAPAVLRNTRLVAGMGMRTGETSFSPLSDSAAAWRSPYEGVNSHSHLRQSLPVGGHMGYQRPPSPPGTRGGWAADGR